MEDIEAQKDEILALQSIFDQSQILINSSGDGCAGCLFVKPELCDNINIFIDQTTAKDAQEFSVQHLCPFELHFNVPVDYPSVNPPHFTLVCKWLTREQVKLGLFH